MTAATAESSHLKPEVGSREKVGMPESLNFASPAAVTSSSKATAPMPPKTGPLTGSPVFTCQGLEGDI